MTQIFHNGQPCHGGDRKTFEVMTSTQPIETFGSVASLLAATSYQGNPDTSRNHKLWNIVSSERYILHMQVLLHINVKFTVENLKSSLVLSSIVLIRHSMSISRCWSRYEADISVSVVQYRSEFDRTNYDINGNV